MPQRPPELLFDRFEVHDELGSGAAAAVYSAHDTKLQHPVALKVLTGETAEIRERTYQEGQLLLQFDHPNIVRVYEIIPYMQDVLVVMELIEGRPLTQVLDETPFDLDDRLRIFGELLSGMAHVHAAGIVHRDLKPENVLLVQRDGRWSPKVIDFGAAYAMGAPQGSGLASATAMGTPGYMAPEQLEEQPVSAATDVFALGAILYEMLSGLPALKRGTVDDTLRATFAGDFEPLGNLVEACPLHVADAVAVALSAEPAKRFKSCAEFYELLFGEDLVVVPPKEVEIRRAPKTPQRVDAAPKRGTAGPSESAAASAFRGKRLVDAPRPPPVADTEDDRWPMLALASVGVAGVGLAVVVWMVLG